jgi:aminopeptidase N
LKVVCNYKSIKRNTSKYGIEIEVSARPDAIEAGYGSYALEEAAKIMDFYSEYFDIVYSLPKSSNVL